MKDIKLTDRDINFDYVRDTDEILQSGTIILTTRKSEFSLAPDLGMDRTSLLGKKFSKEIAANDIYEALEQDERFQNVKTDFDVNYHDRSAKVTLTATIEDEEIGMEVDYA